MRYWERRRNSKRWTMMSGRMDAETISAICLNLFNEVIHNVIDEVIHYLVEIRVCLWRKICRISCI
jgi:hypothetical protein